MSRPWMYSTASFHMHVSNSTHTPHKKHDTAKALFVLNLLFQWQYRHLSRTEIEK